MKEIKTHTLGKLAAITLVLVLVLPISVKFFHIFENHLHEVCTSKDAKHIHQLEKDCEFYKFQLNNYYPLTHTEYQLVSLPETSIKPIGQYQFLSDYQKLHFALRGPPQLI